MMTAESVSAEMRWIDLPPAARDWLRGEQMAVYLPPAPNRADERNLRRVLLEWDALTGRLLREALFGDGEPRSVRMIAEAVAAVAEQLAVTLGDGRP